MPVCLVLVKRCVRGEGICTDANRGLAIIFASVCELRRRECW
jgi:hypothetical protein